MSIVLQHFIRDVRWPAEQVQVAVSSTTTIAGREITRNDEVPISSPAIAKAAKAMEEAIMAELGTGVKKANLPAVVLPAEPGEAPIAPEERASSSKKR